MKTKSFECTWVRVAGHAQRIRSGSPFPWRCFINSSGPEITLRDVKISGSISDANCMFGVDPDGSNALRLTAWIDYFGDCHVDDRAVAHIRLRHPLAQHRTPPPATLLS